MTLFHFLLLAAGSLIGLVASSPIPSNIIQNIETDGTRGQMSNSHFQSNVPRGADVYLMYTGNGETNWPPQSSWLPFDDLFNQNLDIMHSSCVQWHVPANTDQEIQDTRTGIINVAAETGLDSRFILAILLQESNGCVRAPTTSNGARNPGLMQSHNGAATCNDAGIIRMPCPAETITQMIRDGVAGTAAGDGLLQTLAKAPGYGTARYYGAARIYNSGSITASGDLGEGIATRCYASDVANRLVGWSRSQKACTLDGAPLPADYGLPPQGYQLPEELESAQPQNEPYYVPAPHVMAEINHAPSSATGSLAPGVTTACAEYYTVQAGDYCVSITQKFGLSLEVFRALNSNVDNSCGNLWKDYMYCVRGF